MASGSRVENRQRLPQINFNVVLGADESWSIDDGDNFHHLTVNGNVGNAGFALTAMGNGIIDIAGPISGSGGLTVESGAAGNLLALELANTNTYTGATVVEGGRLIVDGSTAAESAVTVSPGGVLGGTGTIGGAITIIGAPGDSDPSQTTGGLLDPGTTRPIDEYGRP